MSLAANTGKVNVDTANLREKADENAKILDLLSLNDTVEIVETTGNWYKIKAKGLTGYVRQDLIKTTTETNNNEKEETNPPSTTEVATSNNENNTQTNNENQVENNTSVETQNNSSEEQSKTATETDIGSNVEETSKPQEQITIGKTIH